MKYYVRQFHGHLDWGWVNEQIPILRVEDTSGIMCIDLDTNTTVAAMIFDNVTPTSVQCHFMVSDAMALRHGFHKDCADLVFNHLGKRTIYGLVPADNVAAIKINKHIGFSVKCVLEDGFKVGVDYLLMELKREDCKYLPTLENSNG